MAGKPARGPTTQEFQDFVRDVESKLRTLDPNPKLRIIWSWDNPKIHGSVANGDWAKGNTPVHVSKKNHTQLPAYSPDMHNVIELSHALICGALQKYINTRRTDQATDSLLPYMEELTTLFHSKLTPTWGLATVKRLFAVTLPAIIESDGDYPEKACR